MRITEESMKNNGAALNGPGRITDDDNAAIYQKERPQLSEREKLQNMSTKDKIWYIWAYYKFYFIGAAFAAFILYSLGSALYLQTFTNVLYCANINNRNGEESDFSILTEDYASWMDLNKKERIITESLFISYGDEATEYNLANMAKVSALVAAQDLDVMFCDAETIDYYAAVSGFQDLETVLSPELLELVQDRLYFAEGADSVPYAYAIDLSGTEFADSCSLMQEPPLLGIVSNTERAEYVYKLVEFIFKQ